MYLVSVIRCDQIKKTEVGRECSTYGGEERCIQVWWGNLRPLERPTHRWEDNIQIDFSRSGMGRHGLDQSG
jgi:hypothetical protein